MNWKIVDALDRLEHADLGSIEHDTWFAIIDVLREVERFREVSRRKASRAAYMAMTYLDKKALAERDAYAAVDEALTNALGPLTELGVLDD